MTTIDQATEMADGLRALAAMVEANPDVAKILAYSLRNISEPVDTRDEIAAVMRAGMRAGADIHKDISGGQYAKVYLRFGPVVVDVFAPREEVCERVVTGTHEVTEEVPEPGALAAVPTIVVTRTVEDVEWRCRPLLADERELEAVAA